MKGPPRFAHTTCVLRLFAQGHKPTTIAKHIPCAESTVYRVLRRHGHRFSGEYTNRAHRGQAKDTLKIHMRTNWTESVCGQGASLYGLKLTVEQAAVTCGRCLRKIGETKKGER